MMESKPFEDRFHQTALWTFIKKLDLEHEFHPIANIFPLLEGQALDDLVQDIKKNGLLKTIVLFENKVLDGRNRYIACKKADVIPRFKQYNKEIDPLSYVISENLKRRHLNSAEKAEIGLIILEEEEKNARGRMEKTQSKEGQKIGSKEHLEGINKATPSEGAPLISSPTNIIFKSIDQNKELRSKDEDPKTIKQNGEALKITAQKMGISSETLTTVKKVKELNNPEINKKWEQAKKGKTTIKAVKMMIDKKTKPREVPKLPEDKYDIIYADPPWEYEFTETPNRTIEKEYPTMNLKDIIKLKIPSADNAILFLW